MKTNHELAREAELKVQILLAVEIPNVATSDLMPEVRKIIADTYAEAMNEADELRKSLETARGELYYWMYAAGAIYKPSGGEERLWIDEGHRGRSEFTVWRFRCGRTTLIATCDCIEHATEVLDGLKEVAMRAERIRQPLPQPPEVTK